MASVIKFRFNFAPAVGEITSLDVFGWHLQVISILYVGGPGASCPVNTTKRSKAVTGWKPTVSQHTHTQLLLSLIIFNSIRNSWFLLTFSKIHGAVYRIWAIEIHPVLSVAALVISPSAIRAPLWFFFMDIGQVSLRTEHNFGYVTSVYVALVGQARVHSLITYPVQTQAYVTYIWMIAHLTIHRRNERAYSNIRTHYR